MTWAGPVLAFLSIGNVTISPALNSTAYAAALAVYGILATNAEQAQGECSKQAPVVFDAHVSLFSMFERGVHLTAAHMLHV